MAVEDPHELFATGIPIDLAASIHVSTGIADPLAVDHEIGLRLRHHAASAIPNESRHPLPVPPPWCAFLAGRSWRLGSGFLTDEDELHDVVTRMAGAGEARSGKGSDRACVPGLDVCHHPAHSELRQGEGRGLADDLGADASAAVASVDAHVDLG